MPPVPTRGPDDISVDEAATGKGPCSDADARLAPTGAASIGPEHCSARVLSEKASGRDLRCSTVVKPRLAATTVRSECEPDPER